ncbi:MAG: phosphatidylglycerophosphatase A [Candidatus Kappaea frigidicola]|nr:phosphatidylglycerophosphatase A [Candidatus Kappaea frigidicola]
MNRKVKLIDKLIDWTVSVLHIGYIPLGGGSVAALAALILYVMIAKSFLLYLVITLAVNIIGLLLVKKSEEIYNEEDPPRVVIDEVGGMLLAFFLIPATPLFLISGYIIFRLLDIVKPFPANYLEHHTGSYGIMLDDIMAGIYTCIILHLIKLFV